MAIIIQQDATEYILLNLSTAQHVLGIFHPSSVAHNTVSTVSGIIETVTATCRERVCLIQPRSRQVAIQVSLMPDTVDTVIWAADDGWNNNRNM